MEALTRHGPRVLSSILLAALLALQFAVFVGVSDWTSHFPGGDEPYYVLKAIHLAEHRAFPRASGEVRLVEEGKAWGATDFRPPGYALFVALCNGFRTDVEGLRFRCGVAQFLLMAVTLFALHRVLTRFVPDVRAHYAAAILFGVQPWTFEYAGSIVPDSLTASLAGLGLAALAGVVDGRHAVRRMAPGALLLGSTFLLRPEMFILVPLVLAAAVMLRSRTHADRATGRVAVAATVVFLAMTLLQVTYRIYFSGSPGLFGRRVLPNPGAFAWVHTWINTEKSGYDAIVFRLRAEEPLSLSEIPARAFAHEGEREAIGRALEIAESVGYGAEADRIFGEVASQRVREKPLRRFVLPRLWRTAHLWLNLETSSTLRNLLEPVPRGIRRVVYGGFFVLKLVVLALTVLLVAILWRRRHRPAPFDGWLVILLVFIVGRTLLIGIGFGSMEHRYVLAAWPPMLVCAAAAAFNLVGRQANGA
ncbi:MAG TPA: hypothetical protein VMT00_13680 [Thermoanaerobaculia bacterium]|nr:hypothetical protein [Thermoanaerobaculia bacterium]